MFKRLKALSIVPFVLFLSGCFLLGAEITVNFDVQGGVPIEPKVYTISTNESVYSYLPTPVREGHTFVGWFAGTEGRDEVNVSQAVEGQLFVYARWEINEYIFEVERPESIGSVDFQLEFDAEIPLEDLEVAGYSFDGLYWDEAYTDSFNFDRLPGEDITVYAKYTPNTYTLIFNDNVLGNSGREVLDVAFTEEIPYYEPTQPEATFEGWYTSNTFATQFDQETMPFNNVQLYAKWDYNEYPLSYYLNGGVNASGVTETSIDYGKLIDKTTPSRPGYIFEGWFTDENFTTPASISFMPNTGVALYAKWELRDYEVVVFEESTLEFIQAVSNYQSSVYLDASNQLYVFGNLFGTAYNTLTNITDLVPLEDDEFITDIQLGSSALMILTNQGSVFTRGNFSSNLGVGNNYINNTRFNNITNRFNGATIIGIYNTREESFAWSDDGRVFMYGASYNNKLISETPLDGDVNSPLEVTELFELNAGETIISIVYGEQSGYALSSEGRVFAWGSNDERQLTGDTLSSSKPIDITDSFSLQTGETIVKIEASNYNGFVLTSNGRLLGWGARWENMVIRWYESPVETPIDLTGDFTLRNNEVFVDIYVGHRVGYAVTNLNRVFSWGSNQEGQLGSNSNEWMNGGYAMNNHLELTSDETIQFISASFGSTHIITTEGRLFVLGSNRDSRLPIPLISTNVPYEIKIDDWKALDTSIYNYEDTLEVVTPEAIVGYTFDAYYLDSDFEEAFTFNAMPDQDLDLYPRYIANEYEIAFVENGGVTTPALTLSYESALNLPTPSRYGYTFEGWYEDEALTNLFEEETMPAEAFTLYAAWEPITYTIDYFINGFLQFEKAAVSDDSALFITQEDRVILFGLYEDPNGFDGYDITDLLGLSDDETITDIYPANEGFFLVTSEDRLLAFGLRNHNSQFEPNTSGTEFNSLTILDLTDLVSLRNGESITKLEIGGWGSVAVLTSSGRIIMWGYPHHDTFLDDEARYELGAFLELNENEVFTDVYYGEQSTMVKTSENRVFVWGENWNGRLGIGNNNKRTTPFDLTERLDAVMGVDSIKLIEMGDYTSVIVTDDDLIYKAGGIIGDQNSFTLLNSQINLRNNETIVEVQSTREYIIVRTNESRVFVYGYKQNSFLSVINAGNEWEINEFEDIFRNVDLLDNEAIIDMDVLDDFAIFTTNTGRAFFIGSTTWYEEMAEGFSPFELQPLEAEGWILEESVVYGIDTEINIKTPQAIAGYTFEGLYIDVNLNQAFGTSSVMNQNLKLYPKYEAVDYAIDFVVNGGITESSITVGFEQALDLPEPTRYGYVFEGWYEDQALTVAFEEETMPAEALTLYASWEPVTFTVDYYANTLLSYEKVAVSDDSALFITEANKVILFGLYDETNGLEGYDITELLGLDSGESITDIYHAKEGFFLVTSEDRLLAFGLRNHNGQFGYENMGQNYNNVTILDITNYANLDDDEGIAKIEQADWGSIALLTTNGRLIMWGWPHHDTVTDDARRYELSEYLTLNAGEVFTDVYYGESSTLVKTSENRVFVWGQNWNGRLGIGNNNQRTTPFDLTERLNAVMGVDSIKLIEMGDYASVIVTDDDLIYKAGGIIGDQNTFTLLNSQIDLNDDETIVEIQSTREYIIVRTNQSRIFVYGYKQNSFLSVINAGDNWSISEFEDIFKDTELLPGESIISMAVKDDFAIFITSNNEAFIIGSATWYEEMVPGFSPFELQTIDYEGWTIYEREVYGIDETITLLDQSEVTDFTLNGWYTSPSLNTSYQGALENVDIVLYGDLEGVPSIVTFEENGGEELVTLSGMSSDKAVLPTPSRSGYTFKGWYLDSQLSQPFNERRLPGGELTLYAKWESRTYTVEYYSLEVVTPKAIAVSENNVLMISESGRLIVFGSPLFQGDSSVDRDLTDALGLRVGEELVSIHAGSYWSETPFMILTNQGRIFGLGYSNNGLLSETTDYDWGLVNQPRDLTRKLELANGEMITKLELKDYNAIALTSLGRVIVWGNNGDSGILGVGNFNWGIQPTDITSSFNLNSEDQIVDISMGTYHVIALSEEDKVFTWGDGTTGELGNNRTEKLNVPTELDSRRINLEENETIIQILTGERLTYLRTSLNRVLVFGDRDNPANLDENNSNIITPLDVTDRIPLAENETISSMTLDYRFLTIYTSLGNQLYIGDFNGIQYQSQLNPLTSQIALSEGESIKSTGTFYNYGVLLTNLGNVYVGGSTLDSVLSDNFNEIKRFTPKVYTLVETQEYSFGEAINFRETTSEWLDVELLSDLDISDPVSYTTMPDEDLTLYESLEE